MRDIIRHKSIKGNRMQNSLITEPGNESPEPVITEKPTVISSFYNKSNYDINFGRSLS